MSDKVLERLARDTVHDISSCLMDVPIAAHGRLTAIVLDALSRNQQEAFMAGITAVWSRSVPDGSCWVFEDDCLHPTAKDAAYAAWLSQRPQEPKP